MPPLPSPNGLLPALDRNGNTDFVAALKRLEVMGSAPPIACCSYPGGGYIFCAAEWCRLGGMSSATRPTVEFAVRFEVHEQNS